MNTESRVRRTQMIGFAAWATLALLQVVWHAWWRPPLHASTLAATVAVVPLLLPLLAMRRPHRALLWAGIVALFYFAHGVSTAWAVPVERVPALLEVCLSAALVGALGAGVRRRQRVGAKAKTGTRDPGPGTRS